MVAATAGSIKLHTEIYDHGNPANATKSEEGQVERRYPSVCRRWMFNYNIHITYLEYYLSLLFGNDADIWNRQRILNSATRSIVDFISILVLLLYIWQLRRSLQQRCSHSYMWSFEFYLHVENTWRITWTFTSTWIHPGLFGGVRVAHLFSFWCCPIICL